MSKRKHNPWAKPKPQKDRINDVMNAKIRDINNRFTFDMVLTGESPNIRKRCPVVGIFRRIEENVSLLPLLRHMKDRAELKVRPFANMQCVGSPTYIHYPPYYIAFVPRFGTPHNPKIVWAGAWIGVKNRAKASDVRSVLDHIADSIKFS